MYSTRDVQRRLKQLGFDPGEVDGIRGRKTIAAIRAFQLARQIKADGIVGPVTLGKLFSDRTGHPPIGTIASSPDVAPWLDIAKRKKGLHETRHRRRLMDFLKLGKGTIGDPALIPWCGDFVETCVAVALPDEPIPDNPYAAINWLKFGKTTTPKPGAILVFWRGSPKSWKGHVGFYVGEDATHYHVLGGNQSNAVTVSRISKKRLRDDGVRWPLTAMESNAERVHRNRNDLSVTTNEA